MVQTLKNFKLETAHNSLQLRQVKGCLELTDQRGWLQSSVDLEQPDRLIMPNLQVLISVILFIPPPAKILLLGTAAGSLLHFLRHHLSAQITALDIDEALISQLLKIGVLPQEDERLAYQVADAFEYIQSCDDQFDLILVDIFSAGQSPKWMRVPEHLRHMHRLLRPEGAVAFNLLIGSDTDFSIFYRYLQAIFRQQTLSLSMRQLENTIAFGFRNRLPRRGTDWYLQSAAQLSQQHGIDYLTTLADIYAGNPQGVIA